MLAGHPEALLITALLAAAHPAAQKNRPMPPPHEPAAITAEAPKSASHATFLMNQKLQQSLPYSNTIDFDIASKNSLSPQDPLNILSNIASPIWTMDHFMQFEKIGAADTGSIKMQGGATVPPQVLGLLDKFDM